MSISPSGVIPVIIFIVILLAYTAQTELAQYIQQSLGYHQPYFLFYLTHSGYLLLLPLHLALAAVLPGQAPIQEQLSILRGVLRLHYGDPRPVEDPAALARVGSRGSLPDVGGQRRPRGRRNSLRRLLSTGSLKEVATGGKAKNRWKWNLGIMGIKLSVLIAIPSCTWYMATPLTSMTEITAIYNVFAFWAYLLAVKMLGEPATTFKLVSVLMAIAGVLVISFGGAALESSPAPKTGSHPLIGDLLALLGSISFAFYEIWYKINISLHDPPKDEDDEEALEGLLAAEDDEVEPQPGTPPPSASAPPSRPSHTRATSARSVLSISTPDRSITHPSSSTYLLYSNTLTTLIGLSTLLLLWLPLPLLHYSALEPFRLPPPHTLPAIAGVILTGVAFNGGFVVLISVWGPLVASVGNLCTLLLVAVADTVVTGVGLRWPVVVGGGLVVAAFAGLIVGARRDAQEVAGEKGVRAEVVV